MYTHIHTNIRGRKRVHTWESTRSSTVSFNRTWLVSLFLSLSLLWPLFSPWNYHFLVYVLHAWTWRRTASSVNRLPDSRLQVRFGGFEGYRWSRTAAFSLFLSSSIGCRGLCWIKTVVPDDYAVFSPPWSTFFSCFDSPRPIGEADSGNQVPRSIWRITKRRKNYPVENGRWLNYAFSASISTISSIPSYIQECSSYRKEFCIINIDRRCSTLFV